MNAGEWEGLRDVLRSHMWADRPGQTCGCGWEASSAWMVDRDQPNRVEQHLAHQAAAVLDWLRARLASDEVRWQVATSINHADDEAIRKTNFEYLSATYDEQADAALTAVLAALDHRDDEGRSGARDGLTCLAAVPPGWPHVPCVRPFKHEGEHSATPKWVDLFGIDPDYTGGQDVNEWLDESRGDARTSGCAHGPTARAPTTPRWRPNWLRGRSWRVGRRGKWWSIR